MAESMVGPSLANREVNGARGMGNRSTTLLSGPAPYLVSDMLALIAATALARVLAAALDGQAPATVFSDADLQTSAAFALLSLAGLAVTGTYNPAIARAFSLVWPRLLGGASLAIASLHLILSVAAGEAYDSAAGTALWASAAVCLVAGRTIAAGGLGALHRRGLGQRPVLLIGDEERLASILTRLDRRGSCYRVAGVIDASALLSGPAGATLQNGSAGGVLSVDLRIATAREILIAAPPSEAPALEMAVRARVSPGARVRLALPPPLGSADPRVEVLEGVPAVQTTQRVLTAQYEVLKRVLDVAAALALLVLAAPFMAVIALAVRADSPGTVFYRQTRVGRYGRAFQMYKFRSMKANAADLRKDLLEFNEASGPLFKLRKDPRITRVGRVIRKLSLDEMPQLLNVLNGTMSLVGPRPPLPDEVERYTPAHFRRLDAVPGITGWWQVNRGKQIDFEEMLRLDTYYIERWSPWLDLWILIRTVPIILTGRGSY